MLYANRAAAHLNAGHFQEAEHDCTRSLQREQSVKVFLRRASALEKMGQLAAAYSEAAKALVLSPQEPAVLQRIEALRHSAAGGATSLVADAKTLQQLRKRAEARAERGAHEQAAAYGAALELLKGESVAEELPCAAAARPDGGMAVDSTLAASC